MSDKYQAMRDACTAYIQPKGNMESREHSVIRSFKTRLEWENVCHPWAILELLDEIATLKATASQESAPGQEAVAPIGYIDRLQLERWDRLRGTEFEMEERAYIGFSTKPFTSEMTDCTLAVYLAPPTDTNLSAQLEAVTREREELVSALRDAINQVEYLHRKFQETGSGNGSIAQWGALIAKCEASR
jgi:hypothetical protein